MYQKKIEWFNDNTDYSIHLFQNLKKKKNIFYLTYMQFFQLVKIDFFFKFLNE